jgi:hypothetical protein
MTKHNSLIKSGLKWQIIVLTIFTLVIGLRGWVDTVYASRPDRNIAQANGQVIGLASNPLECLVLDEDSLTSASGTVHLTWQGEVERARLIITVAGAEAAHTIKINGQPAAQTPVQPAGNLCGEGESFFIPIPPDVVVQGDNQIEITNDALAGDNWSAALVRLEVLGHITMPPQKSEDVGVTDVTAAVQELKTISFMNAYDGTNQEARVQIPDGYDDTPRPLLVAVHPRSGDMFFGEVTFGVEANARGWLLVSPQLHGRWPIPENCLDDDPGTFCQPEDETIKMNPGAYAHASLESQYDTLAAIKHMIQNYNVDTTRIYLTGYSMGAQGGLVTVAKSPHIFAAIFDNKGPTDMDAWYNQQEDFYGGSNSILRATRKECYIVQGSTNTPAFPASHSNNPKNPFCYYRRSGLNYASNLIHTPISITHSINDALVPISHSRNLRDAINDHSPDQLVTIYEENSGGDGGPPAHHSYVPVPGDVLDFLQQFTLTDKNPSHINIVTDETKTFYWLKINQSGSERFTQVEVTRSGNTVIALISDTGPLSLDFNLGDNIINDPLTNVPQPGMGLEEDRQYLIEQEKGTNVVSNTVTYNSDYLNIPINFTGQVMLTISLVGEGGPGTNTKVYLPVITKND